MKVNCFGYLYEIRGYTIFSRSFFLALSKKADVRVVSLYHNVHHEKTPAALEDLEKKGRFDIDFKDPAICIAYGNEMQKFCGSVRIGYVVFEVTRLPRDWVWQLRQLDQVWTPSQWGATVLKENGIDESKVHVVPEGVDTSIFNPNVPSYYELKSDKFKFLVVGRFMERKSQIEVLKAFSQEFKPEEPVQLLLLSLNVEESHLNIKERIAKSVTLRHPEITIITPFDDHRAVANLYRSCNVLVATSKAEGWGLHIIESMACGTPVITTNYSGQTDYVRKENPLQLQVTEFEDIYDPWVYPEKGRYGKWAKINIKDLREKMRWAYEHKDDLVRLGLQDAISVQSHWTWDKAADKAMEILTALG
ncbi:MAG: hypothetical protein DKM50_06610 [Candidatus Margulisiibacteriota bacterium]|nr:MAG: hypothetical protein A2X43_00400 [Candidatus Margulisbacteria bacterium GWD2_39_127]OGI04312.1 MAG: hypothetical protein A2X42_05275 [Candidatus Margulisbacteria bacterium GWF2_38_17]OGI11783.1 MAG: hypothetical protein A2X41_10975 [Candidatus Margulisbacteria bacterium GWE2_39_32]PZM79848.1 MAG: hypothetical protein DKM50_06610 [Candidatus Margulisiibacteriota bacterium]HAR62758.1 hypothetical protein [Candidatus Margulisiibacteriota bacterium]